MNFFKTSVSSNFVLGLLRVLGVVALISLLCLLCYYIVLWNLDEILKLLVPFGVLISAFLAAYSVQKNIERDIEKEEILKNRNKIMLLSILKELTREIETQIKYFGMTIDEQETWKYDEKQQEQRFMKIANELTGLELNSYNSLEIVEKLLEFRTDILDAIQNFDVYMTNPSREEARKFQALLEERKEKVEDLIRVIKEM